MFKSLVGHSTRQLLNVMSFRMIINTMFINNQADKASVLEDAIKHLKQLQERVKKLEEERVGTKKMDQSVILVKRSQVYVEDDSSSYSSICSAASPPSSSLDGVSILKQTMPMIEARVSDRDLLIRIHCEKNKGCLVKILSSLEKFRLEVVNSFTLPFGNKSLVITILSKVKPIYFIFFLFDNISFC